MSLRKRIFSYTFAVVIFVLTFTSLGIVFSYHLHGWNSNRRYKQGYFDGYSFIKPIEDLQQQVGAVPDGIIGPNTIAKYEKALCNQYSTWMFNSNVREFDRKMMARSEK